MLIELELLLNQEKAEMDMYPSVVKNMYQMVDQMVETVEKVETLYLL